MLKEQWFPMPTKRKMNTTCVAVSNSWTNSCNPLRQPTISSVCDWGFGAVWVLYMEEMMIICRMPCSMPSLLGFWWVLRSLKYRVLHSRTKRKRDFSFSVYFLLGFSHAENVFIMRGCCRCNANSAKDWNTCNISTEQLLRKYGAHECYWRHRGPNVSVAQCALHLACWLLVCGNPCKGLGAVVHDWRGLSWTGAGVGCTLRLISREANAPPGCLTVVAQMLCRNRVLSRSILQMTNDGAACDTWPGMLVYALHTSLECTSKNRRACKLLFLVCAVVIVIHFHNTHCA